MVDSFFRRHKNRRSQRNRYRRCHGRLEHLFAHARQKQQQSKRQRDILCPLDAHNLHGCVQGQRGDGRQHGVEQPHLRSGEGAYLKRLRPYIQRHLQLQRQRRGQQHRPRVLRLCGLDESRQRRDVFKRSVGNESHGNQRRHRLHGRALEFRKHNAPESLSRGSHVRGLVQGAVLRE